MMAVISGPIAYSAVTDNAGNSAYSDGWQNGDNGGSGFGAWALTSTANSGFFIGNSANNGTGGNSGNINTSGNSWGLFANSGGLAGAVRPFSAGNLAVGQQFLIRMDNGNIQSGGTVGFGLQNSSGNNRFEFFFVGGGSSYTINIGGVSTSTGIPFTANGLTLVFTQESANGFSLDVTPSGGSTSHFTGTMAASDISRVRLFNSNAGNNAPNDAFFNSIEVVPEPVNTALGVFGVVTLCSVGFRRLLFHERS